MFQILIVIATKNCDDKDSEKTDQVIFSLYSNLKLLVLFIED